MGGIDILLELVLVLLLGGTLLHAVRLQRSLAALRQDRAALHEAAIGFDGGAREAERSILALRQAALQLEAQLKAASELKDDLTYLSDTGVRLADQLESLVRAGRPLGHAPPPGPVRRAESAPLRSQAERNLALALGARA